MSYFPCFHRNTAPLMLIIGLITFYAHGSQGVHFINGWNVNLSVPQMTNTASVDLGSTEKVGLLFSHPNCPFGSICPQGLQTLVQTVSHYLTQSLQRDGFSNSTVRVEQKTNNIEATFSGPAASFYPTALGNFLKAGEKAYNATLSIMASGRWESDWAFFLPWGLAMTQNPTMQLMHFPPDYSLTSQNYLNSATTDRWADLLVINGVDSTQTEAYQAIIDIAPIAAPSTDGDNITEANVYGDYYPYSSSLLSTWAVNSEGLGKPMMAFGSPVHEWINTFMGLNLEVCQVGIGKLINNVSVPVMAANHPSLIYYAAYNGSQENFTGGFEVMSQDLIAACWQSNMAQFPTMDPYATQKACTSQWTHDRYEVCMLLETTIYNKNVEDAVDACNLEYPPQDEKEEHSNRISFLSV